MFWMTVLLFGLTKNLEDASNVSLNPGGGHACARSRNGIDMQMIAGDQ